MKILENIHISVNMIDRLVITDNYSVKCVFILSAVIFVDVLLNISLKKNENVMFYDFIYFAKGFRMRPKVRSTLNPGTVSISSSRNVVHAEKSLWHKLCDFGPIWGLCEPVP